MKLNFFVIFSCSSVLCTHLLLHERMAQKSTMVFFLLSCHGPALYWVAGRNTWIGWQKHAEETTINWWNQHAVASMSSAFKESGVVTFDLTDDDSNRMPKNGKSDEMADARNPKNTVNGFFWGTLYSWRSWVLKKSRGHLSVTESTINEEKRGLVTSLQSWTISLLTYLKLNGCISSVTKSFCPVFCRYENEKIRF